MRLEEIDMPTLDYITIEGFRSIKAIGRLKLRPINILIGANGSGKSNFIGAFSFLHEIREGRLQSYVAKAGGANRLLHFGNKATTEMVFNLWFDEEINCYSLKLATTINDSLFPAGEIISRWDPQDQHPTTERFGEKSGEATISTPHLGVGMYIQKQLDSCRVYHFHDTSTTSPMKRTSEVNDNRFLRNDAGNLAAFLLLLRDKHPDEYSVIRRTVQRVAPFFADFRLDPLASNENTVRLEWRHKDNDDYFDASSLSDGTLRFIALATLLLQPQELRPSVILIDEPELGLHPYAITLLAALIKQASVKTQVIASTQSALLLDNFEPEDVLVAERVKGGTQIQRLEPEPLKSWLEEYSLGQLWEKNEIGGRPGAE